MPRASTNTSTRRRAAAMASQPLKFHQRLVLNQWMLGLFSVTRFEELAGDLKGAHLEGLDENNVSNFHLALRLRLFERKELPHDLLLAYDQNIVRHWIQITARRNAQEKRLLKLKYFQYLTLLFAEIYLDRWFRDPLVTLASFIVANTPYRQVKWWSDGMSKDEFQACNVVFQQDDRDTYVSTILGRIAGTA